MKRLRLEIFARLPDSLRAPCRNGWTEQRRHGTPAECFLEGPAISRDGSLFCVDISNGRVLRLDGDRSWSVAAAYDGWPTGLKIGADGMLYVTDNRHGLLRIAPDSGAHETLVGSFQGTRLFGTNDLAIAPDGSVAFTDQGNSDLRDPYGRVLRWSPGGVELVVDRLPSPNGIAFSPDRRMLYIALTQANAIWRLMLRPDGGAGKLGHAIQLSGSAGGGPDGIAFDAEGRLFVCHALAGCLYVFDRLGGMLARIDTAQGIIPTNLAFDPGSPHMLYVTEAETGTIQCIDLRADAI